MSEASANQSKNETTGGRATEASELGRRAAAVEAEMRADERAAAGWGGVRKIPGALSGRGAGGRAHAGVRRMSCAKRTKMSKLKTSEHDGAAEPTRPRGQFAGGSGVRTGEAQPPRGRASGERPGRLASFALSGERWHV